MEVKEEPRESQSKEEEDSEKLVSPKKMADLQRDLTTLVSNIQTAADAKESMRRTELEEARRIRLERLENDVKSSKEIFEEITAGWSIAQQKAIPQELQEALNHQQQLCAALLDNKKKLIDDLQQELKVGDDRYVKDLRKHTEELDLMMERMEDQIKILTNAYREELAQMERVYQQEMEILLTSDETEWEQKMKELWDDELERLVHRKKKVEEYEVTVHNLMLETTDELGLLMSEQKKKSQALERELQQIKASNVITKLKLIKQKDEIVGHTSYLGNMRSRMYSLQTERKDLNDMFSNQRKQFTKKGQYFSKEYERNIQQYDRIQKKIRRFAVADARKFVDMWLMVEAEVKQLVERVLLTDSLICNRLGLAWQRPHFEFMERSGPIQAQKRASRPVCPTVAQVFHTGQASQCSQRTMDLSVGPRLETDTESTDMEMYKEGTAVQSESGAKVEEGKLSTETLNKVLELLCDEAAVFETAYYILDTQSVSVTGQLASELRPQAIVELFNSKKGFLIEEKLLNLLNPLEKEEQTVVKLGSLLCSFGIEEEDVPKLAGFLLKYKYQQREQTEDVCVGLGESSRQETKSTTHLTSELMDPNHILPALKGFLEQHLRSKESSARLHHSSLHVEARDTSADAAYWESMANIISEDKMKLWDAAEYTLKHYHAVLTEISELVPETESLKQQNAELRMLLQQSLNSRVTTELESP